MTASLGGWKAVSAFIIICSAHVHRGGYEVMVLFKYFGSLLRVLALEHVVVEHVCINEFH
jgi:hypothetical protein